MVAYANLDLDEILGLGFYQCNKENKEIYCVAFKDVKRIFAYEITCQQIRDEFMYNVKVNNTFANPIEPIDVTPKKCKWWQFKCKKIIDEKK